MWLLKKKFHLKVTERNNLVFVVGSELVTSTHSPSCGKVTALDMISIMLLHCYNIALQMIPSNKAKRMCQDSSSSPNMARFCDVLGGGEERRGT